jgi:hypothetical protein
MSQCWLLTSSGGGNEGVGWILAPAPVSRSQAAKRCLTGPRPIAIHCPRFRALWEILFGFQGVRNRDRRDSGANAADTPSRTPSQHRDNNTSSKFIHPLRRPCHGRNFAMDFEGNRHGSVRAYR